MTKSPVLVLTGLVVACGPQAPVSSKNDPTTVHYGDTALVVVINPLVNESNRHDVPTPGTVRSGFRVTSDDGISAETDATGIAVLSPLGAGARTISVKGGNSDASFSVTMTDKQLREVAVAVEGATAKLMLNLDYKTSHVAELSSSSSPSEVSAALSKSDGVVFFKGGTYTGDIDVSGSRVTLFGEGTLGGKVELRGNVKVSGSDSRLRGTTITGNLVVAGSGVGVSFSRVNGTVSSDKSDAMFLENALCGTETITGSGTVVIGNAGVTPMTQCP